MSSTETALGGDRILVAAFEAFARSGFRRTTMADVAAAAGVSRPALYLRVSGKEELLRLVAAAVLAGSTARARAAAADTTRTPAQRLDGVLQAKLGMALDLAERSEHAAELLAEYHRLDAGDSSGYRAGIEELAASVLVDAGADPERAAALAAALTRAVVGLETEPPPPGTAPALLSTLVHTVVDAL